MESCESGAWTTHDISQLQTLTKLLSNTLVLHHTIQYLPISSLLALGATSKSLQGIIHCTPNVFRFLDLSKVKTVQFEISQIDHGGEVWRNVQLDENVTEDDFYGGPLRGVFGKLRRRHILQNVQTLVLDGLSVTSELLTEIILDDSFNVRLLSVREVRNLNERKLMQAIEYSVRPTRAADKPRLQGLYIFGRRDGIEISQSEGLVRGNGSVQSVQVHASRDGVMTSPGAQLGVQINQRSKDALSASLQTIGENLYGDLGVLFPKAPMSGWAQTILNCRGLINFDGILCSGPRHGLTLEFAKEDLNQQQWYLRHTAYLPLSVATISLHGCNSCHSAPEGIITYGDTPPQSLPLLAPPPSHSSTIKAATRSNKTVNGEKARLLHRCRDCLWGRYCENCHKWWCEDCFEVTVMNEEQRPSHVATWELHDVKSTCELGPGNFKVYMGLCVEDCLVREMMSGAGSSGMWG